MFKGPFFKKYTIVKFMSAIMGWGKFLLPKSPISGDIIPTREVYIYIHVCASVSGGGIYRPWLLLKAEVLAFLMNGFFAIFGYSQRIWIGGRF